MINEYLAHAESILREAGKIAKREFGNSPIIREKEFHDIVTQADVQVQEFIRGRINELYPDHGFDSEEDEAPSRDTDFTWVLDPIDGTKYFSRRIPIYSIALALEKQGKLILGIVYSPETNQMFSGAIGAGASLNGSPIKCSPTRELENATICVEIPSSDSSPIERNWGMEKFAILVDRVQRARILGVSALDLCYCASSGFDAYVNLGGATKYCDIAAGQVIVEAAGGVFVTMAKRFVAGPEDLCEKLVELIGLREE